MDTLSEIVRREVERYAVKGLNFDAHLLVSSDGQWLLKTKSSHDSRRQALLSICVETL
jgi:hypothetical protein